MSKIVQDINEDFTLDEMQIVFIELAIHFEGQQKFDHIKLSGKNKLIQNSLDMIDEYGIPPYPSKLLLEFLDCAEYQFRIPKMQVHNLSQEEQDIIIKESLEAGKIGDSIKNVPPCYSTADASNPGCAVCPFLNHCSEERIRNLPPCYGMLFQPFKNGDIDNLCYLCYESLFCRIEMEGGKE